MKVVLTDDQVGDLIDCLQHAKDPCASKMIEMLQAKAEETPLMGRIRFACVEAFNQEGTLEFDEDCAVSIEDGTPNNPPDGAYVQGWQWVANPDLEDPQELHISGLPGCMIVGLRRGSYTNNSATAVAARLKWTKREEGDPEFEDHIISVNIVEGSFGDPPSNKLPDGVFYCKNWSENEPIYRTLLENGIIHETGASIASGHAVAPACYITPKGLKWTTDDLN